MTHGGAAPQVKRKAKARIDAAADSAARHLIEWMGDKKVPFNIRLQAARDLLDRAGVGTDKNAKVTVDIPAFARSIEGILVDVVEGEVVDEPPALPEGES